MGLLVEGTPLKWEDAKKHADHVRKHGIEQFLALWRKYEGKQGAVLRWGDEVEYFVAKLCPIDKWARLPLRAPEILAKLREFRDALPDCNCAKAITWHPEYANWMLEATPGQPYQERLEDLLEVEKNMLLRRQCIQKFLLKGEVLVTLPVFPRIGCPGFTHPQTKPAPHGDVSQSFYVPDECINPHPRFPTLTANIRKRRGEKVQMAVPIFQDANTEQTLSAQRQVLEGKVDVEGQERLPLDSIYLDCMAFGMGAGCLQMTFQAKDVSEARFLYDQLAIFAPIMLALTAATPIWKGMLADTDVRWDVISGSVDDRSKGERGTAEPRPGEKRIPKSRYSSIDCYISTSPLMQDAYNDVEVVINDEAHARLLSAGLDARLAQHVAHLFCRDPLVIFSDKLDLDDEVDNDHFENLQSTNWNTVRFKVPPAKQDDINWRVEFRSMELNLTDFENAAYTVFVMLLTRAITSERLNFYMPISKVDDNMRRAHGRSAARHGKFWMRTDVQHDGDHANHEGATVTEHSDSHLEEMSMDEIINGAEDASGFRGLNHFIRQHLDGLGCAGETRAQIERYLRFVGARAAGELKTTAEYVRDFVLAHKDYAADSAVTELITYDLMQNLSLVTHGDLAVPELLGDFVSRGQLQAALKPSPCAAVIDKALVLQQIISPTRVNE